MSALKIKDAQGNWIEVPMIKGGVKVLLVGNKPMQQVVEILMQKEYEQKQQAMKPTQKVVEQKQVVTIHMQKDMGQQQAAIVHTQKVQKMWQVV